MSEKEKEEINLIELAQKLWTNKKFIIKCSIIGAIVGIVIAFSIPSEYISRVILVSESSTEIGGNMGALASMAGINIGKGIQSDFAPELYPEVLASTSFIEELLNITVTDSKQGINMSLYDYINEGQKEAWWYSIANLFIKVKTLLTPSENLKEETNNKGKLEHNRSISKQKMKVMKTISESYSIKTEKKTGITTVEVMTQSPVISAFLADTVTVILQNYIIDQRTKKAKFDLQNSIELYKIAERDYYSFQDSLASYADKNKNIVLDRYKINRERLQNEVNLAYAIYNQMAQQVQMNKISIQDNTPVFTMIQPPIEPSRPSSPNKKLVLFIYLFLSFSGASAWILRSDILKIIKG